MKIHHQASEVRIQTYLGYPLLVFTHLNLYVHSLENRVSEWVVRRFRCDVVGYAKTVMLGKSPRVENERRRIVRRPGVNGLS
jgi:hypothetical protein